MKGFAQVVLDPIKLHGLGHEERASVDKVEDGCVGGVGFGVLKIFVGEPFVSAQFASDIRGARLHIKPQYVQVWVARAMVGDPGLLFLFVRGWRLRVA